MKRYKMVAPETWPHWVKKDGAERTAADAAACTALLTSASVSYRALDGAPDAAALRYTAGKDFQCGLTKVSRATSLPRYCHVTARSLT